MGKKKKKPKVKYTAIYPGLVDLVQGHNGRVKFLMMTEDGLKVVPSILEVVPSIEEGKVVWMPPPPVTIRWLLPDAGQVLNYYENDTDAELYHDLVAYHQGISELPSEDFYHLLTIWDIHTYLFQRSQYSPYLWLYAIPERGKTRTGKGCTYVAWRGLHTECLRDSYLVRTAEELQPSLFLDTTELWRKAQKSGSEDVLLQRFEAGAKVPRVNHPEKGPHRHTTWFSCYGPTIIATNEPVSEILATRAIQIVMPEVGHDFKDDVLPDHGLPYRERLVAFKARHINGLMPRADKPCRGRLGDILRPFRQVVKLVVPDQETRFMDMCRVFQRQRHECLEDSLEGQVLQAIVELTEEVVFGRITSNAITERINEGVPERWHRKPGTITRCCKAMGFKAPRSCGETHIEVDWELLKKLGGRYLCKSALSALCAQTEEKQEVPESTSSADSADAQNGLLQVHSASDGNHNKCADSADSAENQRVCTGVPEHLRGHIDPELAKRLYD
jgi:hypothetical protein